MVTKQLPLDLRIRSWGGSREGAGRPTSRRGVPHESRDDHAERYPLLITMRFAEDLPSLRRRDVLRLLWKSIRETQTATHRIIHFSLQDNHLHYICESTGKEGVSAGARNLARKFGDGH